METAVKRFAVLATVGMFLVLMMGSSVTNTGSAEGCGKSWPLCHGEFIPEYAFETAVEYSHRLVTAVEGLLIAGTAAGALRIRRGHREVKVLAAFMVGTLILQSGLGASAVMWPQDATIMAAHFGISLVCFASVFLLTRLLYRGEERNVTAPPPLRPSAPVRWATLAAVPFVIVVAYVGAYMRHAGYELACHTWPSCNGAVVPDLGGPEGIAFSHRVLALAAMLLVTWLAGASYRLRPARPALVRVNAMALGLIVLQALVGGAVVLSRLDLWTTLA